MKKFRSMKEPQQLDEALKQLQKSLADLGRDCGNQTSISAEMRRHVNSALAEPLIRALSAAKLRGQLSPSQAQSFADLELHHAEIFYKVLTAEE
ncbi:MAG TPA: hypothetical protein VGW57_07610 [Chthoniobacterales bacterium]|nr:hypothetical protein [Chthoniobacterales bacterium]